MESIKINSSKRVTKSTGVSIITCSNKPDSINNIIKNYKRQDWKVKELIIIINNNKINIDDWKKRIKNKKISIYKIDEKKNLGHCLNFAVMQSKYNYISKFDDDDYYGERYLSKLMPLFNYTGAQIIGKKSFFIYFKKSKILTLKFPYYEKKSVYHLAGATLTFKKEVFNNIKFSENIPVGSDSDFCSRCVASGYKLYSGSRFDYVCVRNSNKDEHTWKIEDEVLIFNAMRIAKTDNFRRYVSSK